MHTLLRTAGPLDIKARNTLAQKAYGKQRRSNEGRASRENYFSVCGQTVDCFLAQICKKDNPELVKAIAWVFKGNDIIFRTQLADLEWNDLPSHDLWDHRVRVSSLCNTQMLRCECI